MGIKFSRQGTRRTGFVPWRGVVVTTGVTAVAAAMLTGATASTVAHPGSGNGVTVVDAAQGADQSAIAQAVPAQAPALYGFAPPAATAAPAVDPQFRIAANLPNGPLGIPGVVLQAYKLAATRVAAESPQCKLPWFLLAGIGRIESGHAGGGNVNEYGDTRTKIRGPVLDGSLAGNEVITDTDGGRWDGDPRHDRAMGPMQFIPSTWKAWGSDANGDGKADPDNIFDATYSAGRYLCAGVTDIMADSNKVGAVLRYNRSMPYVNNVLGWAAAYATGVIPTNGIPEMSHAPAENDKDKKDKDRKKDDKKKDEKDDKSTSPSSPSPKSTPPPQHCLGALCLPPGIGPQQPAPQPKATPKKSAPNRAPATRTPAR
ncbi:murein transglycosylase [Gordonia iterans]|uniref:Murein transglycosylase n=1 Tax=Gordonia iterans TaxID=1004901 RepID=A0A2S0KEN9_9ACTN|nr:lytic transglycosylase domain-containing protein [Gordonia iterans]AVM00124.1 murein transglycosylase [Gordonia iterans]